MKRKIVHIGLMKCASTYLQSRIFPTIVKLKKLKSWRDDPIIFKKIYDHYLTMLLENESQNLKLDNNSFVSFEKLVGYIDPNYWQIFANKNFNAFGKNTHIIIVIREPKEFLSSVYMESCIHSGYIIDPKYFFFEKKAWSSQIISRKFSIADFSYIKLISMYENKFDKVSIIKFEDLFDYELLGKVFELNKFQLNELKKTANLKFKENKSFSNRAVKFVFFIKRILQILNLTFVTNIFRQEEIDHIRNINLNKFYSKENNIKKIKKLNLIKRIILFMNNKIRINTIIWSYFDRFFYDKKFMLNFNELNFINIDKLTKEYNKIKTKI